VSGSESSGGVASSLSSRCRGGSAEVCPTFAGLRLRLRRGRGRGRWRLRGGASGWSRWRAVSGDAPFGGDPALCLEALEGGLAGAVIDEEFVVGALLDGAGDALAVLAAEDQGAEDQQVEGSLKEGEAVLFFSCRHLARVWGNMG